jgi:hypothetical protein
MFITNANSVQKPEKMAAVSGVTATKNLEYVFSSIRVERLIRYRSIEKTALSRNITHLGEGGLFIIDSNMIEL